MLAKLRERRRVRKEEVASLLPTCPRHVPPRFANDDAELPKGRETPRGRWLQRSHKSGWVGFSSLYPKLWGMP